MAMQKWTLDESKFLTKEEISLLRKIARHRAKNYKTGMREWFIIELGLATGLRVQEMANLKCGDIKISDTRSSLVVRNGKCGKKRIVWFGKRFKKHLLKYFTWKKQVGESTEDDAPLIFSTNTKSHITKRGIQKAFQRCAKRAGLNHSIHHLRHTYATLLLKASNNNLRLVQEMLGHSSIKTTEVYAHVTDEDIQKAVNKL